MEGKDTLLGALFTIAVADISMSLDNVVAVAAIAREDTQLLIFGLIMSDCDDGLFCVNDHAVYAPLPMGVLYGLYSFWFT